ncbi:MAG TPA: hypothetical protein VMQ63_06815 [Stellaceae bacterium]|jgi:hypothetical protein|nr:hypothetical protein [Stellaceae bacterium]
MADQFSFDISGRKRGKIKTLSLDEQIEDFLDARGGLRLADADFGETLFKHLPRRLSDIFKPKRG